MNYRVCVIKYGYIDIEADNADEALEVANDADDKDFDWSEFDEAEIVEEFSN